MIGRGGAKQGDLNRAPGLSSQTPRLREGVLQDKRESSKKLSCFIFCFSEFVFASRHGSGIRRSLCVLGEGSVGLSRWGVGNLSVTEDQINTAQSWGGPALITPENILQTTLIYIVIKLHSCRLDLQKQCVIRWLLPHTLGRLGTCWHLCPVPATVAAALHLVQNRPHHHYCSSTHPKALCS